MSDSIIQVRGLGKSYNISHEGGNESYTALRDVITNQAKKIFSFPKNLRSEVKRTKSNAEEFWALNDVSFDIKQGERVGIIGRNGAGKSTLLKILSRITEPTKGEMRIKGRVASLLEVGTGFHPELTGRENVYLNGAILGMSRSEIKRKFDEIVDFAEVEKFLDTPVKRYSSGMYTRLAFAVAANLEPEILIVDEVLAVGDAQFQKKCLGRMEDVSNNEGRTVLFVSHNINAIRSLCKKGLLLNKGQLQANGNIENIIKLYASNNYSYTDDINLFRKGIKSNFHIEKIFLNKNLYSFNENIELSITTKSNENADNFFFGISVWSREGVCVGSTMTNNFFSMNAGIPTTSKFTFTNLNLAPGEYHFTIALAKGGVYDIVDSIIGYPIIEITNINLNNTLHDLWSPSWGNVVLSYSNYQISRI